MLGEKMNAANKINETIKIRLIKTLHFLLVLASFYVFWLLFRYKSFIFVHTKGFRYNYFVAVGYAVIILFFFRTYNAYLLGFTRIRDLIIAQFTSQLFSIIIIYFAVSIGWAKWHSPVLFFGLLAIQLLIDVAWSYCASYLFYKFNPTKNAILLYCTDIDRNRIKHAGRKPAERLYCVKKELCCVDRDYQSIVNELDEYEVIIVSGLETDIRNRIAEYCVANSVHGFFLPQVGDVILHGAEHIQSFPSPVLHTSSKSPSPEYLFVKRTFDIIASVLGIVVLSPLMAITAVAIKAYDKGPVLYKQTRLTKDGKEFKILKFRSMRVDAEKDGIARLSTGELDERITPIGRIARKCRLDELPQLFNILKGDMTIVGPRPERPEIAEQYYEFLPEFKLRLQVKAGLTGYAQVYGKYNTEPYEKLEFDLLYINSMSLVTDLKLMCATVGILFKKESTEGVQI